MDHLIYSTDQIGLDQVNPKYSVLRRSRRYRRTTKNFRNQLYTSTSILSKLDGFKIIETLASYPKGPIRGARYVY